MPPQTVHVAVDLLCTRGHLGNLVKATLKRQRRRAADDRTVDGLRACPRIRQHPLAQQEGVIEVTFGHRHHGGQAINEQPAGGIGNPVAQHLQNLMGTLGVTDRPLQVGNPSRHPSPAALL